MTQWTAIITITADEYDIMRSFAKSCLEHLHRVGDHRSATIAGGGAQNNYEIKITGPIELRIRNLREEADRLEKELTK